jgi:catechol 2,3-dioxygenase-like lactoylglutathione lyase family enzyme
MDAPVDSAGPCGRFLHMNLNVVDAEASRRFYEQVTGTTLRMRAERSPEPGTALELGDGLVDTEVLFLYDGRGPRASPALEIVEWIDPRTAGLAYDDATHPGMQGLGYTVASLDASRQLVEPLGGRVVTESKQSVFIDDGLRCLVVVDPDGVVVELVEAAPAETPRALGLRASVSDLAASLEFYRAIGFAVVSPPATVTLPAGQCGPGQDSGATVQLARLALPHDTPPHQLVLVQWGAGERRRAHGHANDRGLYRMALQVENATEASELVGMRGYAYRGPFDLGVPGTPVAKLLISFFRDPDGMLVEFVERPGSAFAR